MQVKFVDENQLEKTENPSGLLSLTFGRIYTVLTISSDYFRLLSDDLRSPNNKPIYKSRWARPDLRSEEEKKARPYPDQYAPEPVLYSQELFEVVDYSEPSFWVCTVDEDGDRFCSPKEWMHAGFWEDYFDRQPEAHALFWDVYERLYLEG